MYRCYDANHPPYFFIKCLCFVLHISSDMVKFLNNGSVITERPTQGQGNAL